MAPILGRPIARLRRAPIPIACFGGIGFDPGAGLETTRIKKHAKGVVLLGTVAKKVERLLGARGFIFSEIRLLARQVKHPEVAGRIEIVQLRRRAVEAKSLAVVSPDTDALVITGCQ